ncbi:hypothetical protein V5O48_005857 [Marasmius crinis-equi]|uniref:Uncharacterized protein n=1 Tax=Marasmius crinis-equi TaxID=585013 RepID=A0ABR3FLA3_9AGAR
MVKVPTDNPSDNLQGNCLEVELCYWDKDKSDYCDRAREFIPQANRRIIKPASPKEPPFTRHYAYVEARPDLPWSLYIDAFSDPDRDILLYVYLDGTLVREDIIFKAPTKVMSYIFSHADGDPSTSSDSSTARCDSYIGTIRVGLFEVNLGERHSVDNYSTDKHPVDSSCSIHEQKSALGVAHVAGQGEAISEEYRWIPGEFSYECEEVDKLVEICLLYRPLAFLQTRPIVTHPVGINRYQPKKKTAKLQRWQPLIIRHPNAFTDLPGNSSHRHITEDAPSPDKNSLEPPRRSQRLALAAQKQHTPQEDEDGSDESADDEDEDKEVDQLDEDEEPKKGQTQPMEIDSPRQPQEDSAEANPEQLNPSSAASPGACTSIKYEAGSPFITHPTPNANRAADTPVQVEAEATSPATRRTSKDKARSSMSVKHETDVPSRYPTLVNNESPEDSTVTQSSQSLPRNGTELVKKEEEGPAWLANILNDKDRIRLDLYIEEQVATRTKRQLKREDWETSHNKKQRIKPLSPPPEDAEIIEIDLDSELGIMAETKNLDELAKLEVKLLYHDAANSTYYEATKYLPEGQQVWIVKYPGKKQVPVACHVAYVEARSNIKWRLLVEAFRDPHRDLLIYLYLDEMFACRRIIEKGPRAVVSFLLSHPDGNPSAFVFRDALASDSSEARCDPVVGAISVGLSEINLVRNQRKKNKKRFLNPTQTVHEKKFASGVAHVVGEEAPVDNLDQPHEEFRFAYDEVKNEAEHRLLYRSHDFLQTRPVVNPAMDIGEEIIIRNFDSSDDDAEYRPAQKKAKPRRPRRHITEDAPSPDENLEPPPPLRRSQRFIPGAQKRRTSLEDDDGSDENADEEDEGEVDQLDGDEAPEQGDNGEPMDIDDLYSEGERPVKVESEPNPTSLVSPNVRTFIKREACSPLAITYSMPSAHRAVGASVKLDPGATRDHAEGEKAINSRSVKRENNSPPRDHRTICRTRHLALVKNEPEGSTITQLSQSLTQNGVKSGKKEEEDPECLNLFKDEQMAQLDEYIQKKVKKEVEERVALRLSAKRQREESETSCSNKRRAERSEIIEID